jgi:hypothetical protein
MLGREVTKPVNLMFGVPSEHFTGEGEYLTQLDEVMKKAHDFARTNMGQGLMRQKRDYDQSISYNTYDTGDLVYKLRFGAKKGISSKFLPVFEGPFVVKDVISPLLYRILGRKKTLVVHHDKLRMCNDRFIPFWVRRKRQEILSLDETIPYDAAEMDPPEEGVRDLFSSEGGRDEIRDDLGNSDGDSGLVSESNSEGDGGVTQSLNGATDEGSEVVPKTTRSGRRVRMNPYFEDYDLR